MKQTHLRLVLSLGLTLSAQASFENFDNQRLGSFTSLAIDSANLSITSGQAEISNGSSYVPGTTLRLLGGTTGTSVTITPTSSYTQDQILKINAERWTSATPFTFRIQAISNTNTTTTIYTGDSTVLIAKNTLVQCTVPAGTKQITISCTSPANTGVILDNLEIHENVPFAISAVKTYQPPIPVMIGKNNNPVVAVNIRTIDQNAIGKRVTSLSINLSGTTDLNDLRNVKIVSTGSTQNIQESLNATTNQLTTTSYTAFGTGQTPDQILTFDGDYTLKSGDNWFWVMVDPETNVDIDNRVDAGFTQIGLDDGTILTPEISSPIGSQHIGYAFKKLNDDGVKGYRIPGLTTTNEGTLIAVYDNRYSGNTDLPADIDVGMSRSTDGGQTWSAMKTIMNMGAGSTNGVGDPTVFTDTVSGRIWASAIWASNSKAYNTSAPGLDPSVTAQLVMTYSDDDGLTWFTPYSITSQVKNPAWRLLFNGPGSGITMKNGTLVMPVQYRINDSGGTVFSSIIHSTDRGTTWKINNGSMPRTNEAQVVELSDSTLMLNCRSEGGGGLRRVATTKNLGKSWSVIQHRAGSSPSNNPSMLEDPTCQGSILRCDHPTYGTIFFHSNPSMTSGPRRDMTIKISRDNCRTWPFNLRTRYDLRNCFGYSSISIYNNEYLCILYEGSLELRFIRIPISELMDPSNSLK